MFQTPAEVLTYLAAQEIAMVDLKITSLTGQWLHITIPARQFTQKHMEEGVGFDGSSGSGFARTEDGDVAARPDVATGFVDPFMEHPTLSFLCTTVAADTKQPWPADPRNIAARAVQYMRSRGRADEAWMAPEFEFHVLDRVDVRHTPYDTCVRIVSSEVETGGASAGIAAKAGYLRTPPGDQLHDFRTEVALTLEKLGVAVRYHHHEVGAPGQCEIEVDMQPLLRAADQAMLVKYAIKNVARRRGKLATFMPKPIFGEAGNGMHVHQRLTRGGLPLFYERSRGRYADLSDTALHYVAGLLTHGRAMTGFTNPSTNSFKRLVEGYEAPVQLFYSLANRCAAIRVPRYAVSPDDKRIEYRPPDFTGNVYLTLAVMLMAGLDGIESRIEADPKRFGPFETDLSRESDVQRRAITQLPRSLAEALDALRSDHAFLTRGEVFHEAFIDGWIAAKTARDLRPVAARPHPHEYELYLDA